MTPLEWRLYKIKTRITHGTISHYLHKFLAKRDIETGLKYYMLDNVKIYYADNRKEIMKLPHAIGCAYEETDLEGFNKAWSKT
jgi:hypothetical protein